MNNPVQWILLAAGFVLMLAPLAAAIGMRRRVQHAVPGSQSRMWGLAAGLAFCGLVATGVGVLATGGELSPRLRWLDELATGLAQALGPWTTPMLITVVILVVVGSGVLARIVTKPTTFPQTADVAVIRSLVRKGASSAALRERYASAFALEAGELESAVRLGAMDARADRLVGAAGAYVRVPAHPALGGLSMDGMRRIAALARSVHDARTPKAGEAPLNELIDIVARLDAGEVVRES